MTARIFYESHAHTPLCKHAVGNPTEYAAKAKERGLLGLTVTCHNPMPNDFSASVRMHPAEFDDYIDLVEQTRLEWKDDVDVRLGLEADYFAGYEPWLEKQLASANFHYVLGSVHPQLHEFREAYWTGDALLFQRIYFQQLAAAAETGLFDCLAHPDLVKNHTAEEWDEQRILDEICLALDRIAKTGIAMELNTSGVNKTIEEMNPFPGMLREMNRRDIPVVIGADAHTPARVGAGYHAALELLEACGYSTVSFYANRERQDLAIPAVRESLAVAGPLG